MPIWSQKKDIIQKVLQNQVTIVTGETGSGKTTQVPQFILDNSFDNQSPCKIICAEPRRLGMLCIDQHNGKTNYSNTTLVYEAKTISSLYLL